MVTFTVHPSLEAEVDVLAGIDEQLSGVVGAECDLARQCRGVSTDQDVELGVDVADLRFEFQYPAREGAKHELGGGVWVLQLGPGLAALARTALALPPDPTATQAARPGRS